MNRKYRILVFVVPSIVVVGCIVFVLGLAISDFWRYRQFKSFQKSAESEARCTVIEAKGRYLDTTYLAVEFDSHNDSADLSRFANLAVEHPGAPDSLGILFTGGNWTADDVSAIKLLEAKSFVGLSGDGLAPDAKAELLRALPRARWLDDATSP